MATLKPINFTMTPLLVWSPPGCAKTAMLLAIAKGGYGIGYDEAMHKYKVPAWVREIFENSRPFVEQVLAAGSFSLLAGQDDPIDGCGVVEIKGGATKRAIPLYFLIACHIPILIFCDEMTACSPEQQNMILRVSDDSRSLYGYTLHPGSRVVGAANPPEYAAGAARELPAPVLSRYRHRTIGAEYALDWMNRQPHQFIRLAGAYCAKNPAAALAKPEEMTAAVSEQRPFVCPRSWTRAAVEIMENDMELLPEYIGAPGAIAFFNWMKTMDLPDVKEIAEGTLADVPKQGDRCMVTAESLVGFIGDKPSDKHMQNTMRWFLAAAEAGQAGNAVTALRTLSTTVGATKLSKFARELAPYAATLKLAGQL